MSNTHVFSGNDSLDAAISSTCGKGRGIASSRSGFAKYFKNNWLVKTLDLQAGLPLDSLEIHEGNLPGHADQEIRRLAASSAPSAFQSPDWNSVCHAIENANGSLTPVHIIGYASERAVMYFPMTRQAILNRSFLRWNGHQFSDYCMPVVEKSCVAIFTQPVVIVQGISRHRRHL